MMIEYVIDNLLTADSDPVSELSCSGLDVDNCLQDLEIPPLSLREPKSLDLRKYLQSQERVIDVQKILSNKSTLSTDLFQHNIFHNQKVHMGNGLRWSRHLDTESRSPAQISVSNVSSPTESMSPSIKEVTHSVHSKVETHLPDVDLGDVVKVRSMEEVESDHENILIVLQEDEIQDLNESQMSPNIQTEDLDESDDIADVADDLMEEFQELVKEKSVRRRFINLLNNLWADRIQRKIARTYMREEQEGDQYYRSSYLAFPTMTRAQAERRKRRHLIKQDRQRQCLKNYLDLYWQKQRAQKEELRQKEEQRYEKWASEHGQSLPDSSPDQPKERMSKWEKRLLRVREFFSCSSSCRQ